jgi:integrase/recombinase XerD
LLNYVNKNDIIDIGDRFIMKEVLIERIQNEMVLFLNNKQMEELRNTLEKSLINFKISKFNESDINDDYLFENKKVLDVFAYSKQVEGCSDRTLKYYIETIDKMIKETDRNLKEITTDDLRKYLSNYKDSNKLSTVTVDNVRRILSSFFGWLEDEDYIVKSPVRRIHKIKTPKVVKETFTDENIEVLRDNCSEIRNLSIVEILISTGMRVGELVKLDITDINFNDRSCIVLGKGNSEREVYFDAKTKLHLLQYIGSRKDDNKGLFVSLKKPYNRLSIAGIELIIRKLGKVTNIHKVYPHKFRRTLATMAIDKGMPIEQVQKLLGHVKIETTMHYAMVSQNNVKISHRKYLG